MSTSKKTNPKPTWFKTKGYLHLTPNINHNDNWSNIKQKIEDDKYIGEYAFFPLIHSIIRERKYKKWDKKKYEPLVSGKRRSHKFISKKTGKTERTTKPRPLHYSTHFDALIYGYYAYILQKQYEKKLRQIDGLSNCITAYRKIKIDESLDDGVKGNGKSTIHFAKDIFDEVSRQAQQFGEVSVLTFDIKSFFSSLDHKQLYNIWASIMDFDELPKNHFNVYKATTNFSYVLLDDLRTHQNKKGKKAGFNEKKLAHIRKINGYKCFFESTKDFRRAIKSGELRIYKHPFKNEEKEPIGIPQGLPISAVLANLYLYDFDVNIYNTLVKTEKCFYRRYSDDIIIICQPKEVERIKKDVSRFIQDTKLKLSEDKTETFIFKYLEYNKNKDRRLTSIRIDKDGQEFVDSPLTYLGFEFRGYNILVKSANIAKFYRRLISIVKRRARRAKIGLEKDPNQIKAIYIGQVKKLIKIIPKKKDSDGSDVKQLFRNRKILTLNEKGEFDFRNKEVKIKKQSNYFTYINRAGSIMESKEIVLQLKKKKHILFSAIRKHITKVN